MYSAHVLRAHAGLHFTLGLVEMAIYALPDGRRLVPPRVLARTELVTWHVVAAPEGYVVQKAEGDAVEADIAESERSAIADAQQAFWAEFVSGLKLDDPEQPRPTAARQNHTSLSL